MATYKVPQDVEADDKLIGPFSFRQFIYLIIVFLSMAGMYGLGRLFLPLAIIPLPIIVFFGAIALPLRKDQPMEVFMAAMLSFYLKPRKKMWDPDGVDSLIEITAPKIVEVPLTKDLSQNEARKRLSYLAEVVDSQGWAVRGNDIQIPNSALTADTYYEAQDTDDILDDYNSTSQNLDYKLNQSDAQRHQNMLDIVNHKVAYPSQSIAQIPVVLNDDTTQTQTQQPPQANQAYIEPDPQVTFNPYPTIQQSVLQPIDYSQPTYQANQIPQNTQPTVQSYQAPTLNNTTPSETNRQSNQPNTSTIQPSTDIIELANNKNLSVATIAKEAHRINKKRSMDQEVVISLR